MFIQSIETDEVYHTSRAYGRRQELPRKWHNVMHSSAVVVPTLYGGCNIATVIADKPLLNTGNILLFTAPQESGSILERGWGAHFPVLEPPIAPFLGPLQCWCNFSKMTRKLQKLAWAGMHVSD